MSEPTVHDWVKIGNDMRVVLNRIRAQVGEAPLPMVKVEDSRLPTEEEIQEFDKIEPGLSERIRASAHEEMEHRLSLERSEGRLTIFLVAVGCGLTTACFLFLLWRAFNRS